MRKIYESEGGRVPKQFSLENYTSPFVVQDWHWPTNGGLLVKAHRLYIIPKLRTVVEIGYFTTIEGMGGRNIVNMGEFILCIDISGISWPCTYETDILQKNPEAFVLNHPSPSGDLWWVKTAVVGIEW